MDILRKALVAINPTSSRLKLFLDKIKHPEKLCVDDDFEFAKQKWDKIHKGPDLKLGNLVSVLNSKPNTIKVPKKLEDSHVGNLFISALQGANEVKVELSGALEKSCEP
ncbi:hypothetical protein O181_074993 [Austropuccinia psidii MF-1]|uniref:Uncharacterized protein n=1 Tax=Austropuccinia psidii MF-1 TaxID=1389203 RepID=A0A9Q3F800_9BASI|nr:hypothetical protein [Austropuccinia psidii MF-1]